MSVTIVSTTDSPEQIQAALGQKLEPKVETPKIEPEKTEVADEVAKETDEQVPSEKEKIEAEEEALGDKDVALGKSAEKRIKKLLKREADAKREAQYWRDAAQKKGEPVAEKPVEKKPDNSERPNENDFKSHEDWLDAFIDWKADQKLAEKTARQEAKQKETQVKSQFERARDEYLSKAKDFAKEHDDFDDLISDLDDTPMSLTVQEVLLGSKGGPELAYALAQDKDEYKRICALPAIEAAIELGVMRSKIQSSDKKQEVKTTKASKPINPVGGGKGGDSKSLDDLPFKEFEKRRIAELKASGRKF